MFDSLGLGGGEAFPTARPRVPLYLTSQIHDASSFSTPTAIRVFRDIWSEAAVEGPVLHSQRLALHIGTHVQALILDGLNTTSVQLSSLSDSERQQALSSEIPPSPTDFTSRPPTPSPGSSLFCHGWVVGIDSDPQITRCSTSNRRPPSDGF